jgi:MFS family permease
LHRARLLRPVQHWPKMATKSIQTGPAVHYGWFIVGAGTLCIFACLGLGRFSLGMLLPSMGKALNLSYAQMGLISTSNFVGYLAGVLLGSRLMKTFGARRLIGAALLLVGLSMISVGMTSRLSLLVVFYMATGVGSALANVPIMALVSVWFTSCKRGKAAGFVVIGSGPAIVLSGWLVPLLNGMFTDGWRVNWFVLGSVVTLAAAVCFLIIRNSPQEMGLLPIDSVLNQSSRHSGTPSREVTLRSPVVLHCAAIYFLFGFTYVIYVTFIVTALVRERGFPESIAGHFWSWVGLLSLFSGPVFGTFSDRFGRKAALITVFTIQAVAYLFMALDLPEIFLYFSIGCFGIVAWSIPSIMAALIGDYAGHQRVAAIFGFVTFVFGLGQITGPYLAGALAQATGRFSGSFLMAAGMAVLAVVLSSRLPGICTEKSLQEPDRHSIDT